MMKIWNNIERFKRIKQFIINELVFKKLSNW